MKFDFNYVEKLPVKKIPGKNLAPKKTVEEMAEEIDGEITDRNNKIINGIRTSAETQFPQKVVKTTKQEEISENRVSATTIRRRPLQKAA